MVLCTGTGRCVPGNNPVKKYFLSGYRNRVEPNFLYNIFCLNRIHMQLCMQRLQCVPSGTAEMLRYMCVPGTGTSVNCNTVMNLRG